MMQKAELSSVGVWKEITEPIILKMIEIILSMFVYDEI